MEDLKFNEIENKTQAWSFGQHQDFVNLIITLKNGGISIDEFVEFVEQKKSKAAAINRSVNSMTPEQQQQIQALARKCPNCDNVLSLFPVEQENESGWESVWRCSSCIGCKEKDKQDETDPNERCTFEEFSTRPFQEILKEHNEKLLVLNSNEAGYQLSVNIQWNTGKEKISHFFFSGIPLVISFQLISNGIPEKKK